MVIGHLEPKNVMQYFEQLAAIPRPSGKEKKVSDFLLNFAKQKNLEVVQDKYNNILIRKPATPGYENAKPIILQGHMDMVPEANQTSKHNFDTDPIQLRVEGDFIYATDTTLGADNGIAVAMMMAICDETNIKHPELEMLITTDEEVGMTGAIHLDPTLLKSRQMINIDTEESGEIYVSCAGGVRTELVIPFASMPAKGKALEISITGLSGGHSGMQIHEQKGNSNKLIGRALATILENFEFNLVHISGGSKENAIPREANAIIIIDESKQPQIEKIIADLNTTYKKEFSISDSGVLLSYKSIENPEYMMSLEVSRNIVTALNFHPYGISAMSLSIPGLVQTSINPGVVIQNSQEVRIISLLRSSIFSESQFIEQQLKGFAKLIGGKLETYDPYPAWEFNAISSLRDTAIKVGKDIFNKDIEMKAVHAGLECGVIAEKFPDGFDAISIGPDIFDPHTPDEHMKISSVKPSYEWLLKILENSK